MRQLVRPDPVGLVRPRLDRSEWKRRRGAKRAAMRDCAIARVDALSRKHLPSSDWRFSRAAALDVARKLMFVTSEDGATTLALQHPAGMLSLKALAQTLGERSLDPGAYLPESMPVPDEPYRIFVEWLEETILPFVEKGHWPHDEDPLRERRPF